MQTFLISVATAALGVLLLTGLLHAAPKLGAPGRAFSNAAAKAPLLDFIVAFFTWIPWVVALAVAGWQSFLGVIAGQILGLAVWIIIHETAHLEARRGPRIVTFINRAVGRWRNHAALWVTVMSLPVFWIIRFAEIFTYPFLVWLLRFPRYRHSDWVNVSRHKFKGLIGHDLIWCLYCDWMTGVYALGAEMLRNVESFWCPIRFSDNAKCENCRIDFPDIDGGWVHPSKDMKAVVETLAHHYGTGRREWFGHPARLTINGNPVETGPDCGTSSGCSR